MNAENYEMLITNIEILMRKQGINQARLIEATGIAQPQMSKGLNRTNKGQLTFEQIWKIADYFKVSIDFLVGRKTEPTETESLPAAAVCRQLMQLVESDMVSYKEIEVEEDMYMREYSPDPNDYPYQWRKGKNKYTAFYFLVQFIKCGISHNLIALESCQCFLSIDNGRNALRHFLTVGGIQTVCFLLFIFFHSLPSILKTGIDRHHRHHPDRLS